MRRILVTSAFTCSFVLFSLSVHAAAQSKGGDHKQSHEPQSDGQPQPNTSTGTAKNAPHNNAPSAGQTTGTSGSLHGLVGDSDANGVGKLQGVTVTVDGKSAITDAKGFFQIDNVAFGQKSVAFKLTGWADGTYSPLNFTAAFVNSGGAVSMYLKRTSGSQATAK